MDKRLSCSSKQKVLHLTVHTACKQPSRLQIYKSTALSRYSEVTKAVPWEISYKMSLLKFHLQCCRFEACARAVVDRKQSVIHVSDKQAMYAYNAPCLSDRLPRDVENEFYNCFTKILPEVGAKRSRKKKKKV